MVKIIEDDIEMMAAQQLEALGYSYRYGPDIAPDGSLPERSSYDEVLLVRSEVGVLLYDVEETFVTT